MKAETKAKRRVTLSIVGLGWLDETETDSIPDARPVQVSDQGEIVDNKPLPSHTPGGFVELDAVPPKRDGSAYTKPEIIQLIQHWQQRCGQAGVSYPSYPGGQQPMALSELVLFNYGRRLRWLYEQAQQPGGPA